MYENAAISIELMRAVLAQEGCAAATRTLEGLEIMSRSGVEVALDAVRSIRVQSRAAREAQSFAVQALEQALLPVAA